MQSWVDDMLSCSYKPTYVDNIVPMITLAYGVFDILHGVKDGWEHFFHGIFLTATCLYLYAVGELHYLTFALLMETSSIFLNLRPLKAFWIDMAFALLFFIYRWIICPLGWTKFILGGYSEDNCVRYETWLVVLCGGIFFHGLNIHWGIKIMFKILKKIRLPKKKI